MTGIAAEEHLGHEHARHSHDGHHHRHGQGGHDESRRLGWALAILFVFMLVEVVGGAATGSLALLADAGHMLTDAASLALALLIARISRSAPTPQRTYGLVRAEVFGALLNGSALIVIVGWIFWEAWQRFHDPPTVLGLPMLIVAVVGLLANIAVARLLHAGHKHNLNVEAAYLHVLGDMLGSVGAIIAAALVWLTGWTLADPIVSALIGLLILGSTIGLLRRSVDVLLNSTPPGIDFGEVRAALAGLPHVTDVHDLHIWSLSSTTPILTAHLTLAEECSDSAHWQLCLREAQTMLAERFDIVHSTLQLEPGSHPRDSRHV